MKHYLNNPDDWREVERTPFEGFTYLRLERT